ncbi:hypothetical protein BV20DRAFT_953296 [Pilatotrama ljubarskyi]|nr:hypothetical protein BV20DRAFT_953296 [Pilatotrama ljubarskyi]
MDLPTLKNNYFLVYIQDVPNAQRSKHQQAHMEQNLPLIQNEYIKVGGALLPQDGKSSDADALEKLVGSFMVVQADRIETVWDLLKKDAYYTSGEVWDHNKIFVTPAYIATPEAKFE